MLGPVTLRRRSIARDARFESLNPATGRRFERDVHFSGDQHRSCKLIPATAIAILAQPVGATNGDRRHGIFRDTLRGDLACFSAKFFERLSFFRQ